MQPRLNHQQQSQRYALAFGVSLLALACMIVSVTLSLFPDAAVVAGSAVVAIAWLALGGLALSIAIPTVPPPAGGQRWQRQSHYPSASRPIDSSRRHQSLTPPTPQVASLTDGVALLRATDSRTWFACPTIGGEHEEIYLCRTRATGSSVRRRIVRNHRQNGHNHPNLLNQREIPTPDSTALENAWQPQIVLVQG